MVRDTGGKFVKGHPYLGGGRTKRSTEEQYIGIMLKSITPDRWQAIVDKAFEQAADGDDKARKWLSDYIIGTPVQRTELSGADGAPMALVLTQFIDE